MNINKNLIIIIFAVIILSFSALIMVIQAKTEDTNKLAGEQLSETSYSLPKSNNLLAQGIEDRDEANDQAKYRKIKVTITAYSSTTWQTDSTPFITANGSYVKEGIVANNMLPFGTELKIPELYGNKVFTVEDRMHPRKGSYWVDIWFPTLEQAKNFGIKQTYVEVLEI